MHIYFKYMIHIASILKPEKLPVSAVIVRRLLIKAKLSARSPHKAPLLKKLHARNRLKHRCSEEKWCNILWTDESKIVLFRSSGHRQYVRRPPGIEFKPQYTVKTVKHGGAKIMVWGYFSDYGVGPVYHIPGIIDHEYIKILEEIMLPHAEGNAPEMGVSTKQWPWTHE